VTAIFIQRTFNFRLNIDMQIVTRFSLTSLLIIDEIIFLLCIRHNMNFENFQSILRICSLNLKIAYYSFQHIVCWKKPTCYYSEYKMPTNKKLTLSVKKERVKN